MTSHSQFPQPPRFAAWLLSLFALDDAAEHILGDLLEEFGRLFAKSGARAARRWYWRQALKTILQLALLGFRTAPWLTTAAVVTGFLLRRFTARWVEPCIFSVLDRYQVYEHHFSIFMFFASTGIDIGHFLDFLCIGFVVALVAKGREMTATLALGFYWIGLTIVSLPFVVMQSGFATALSRETVYFADSLAVVLAGAIIRMHRLHALQRRLPA
jgi:hypothetical protein